MEPLIRSNIEIFFNENFENAKYLNYDLYYDINLGQFVIDPDKQDLKKLKKTNYPNFEIMILNSYINDFLLDSPKGNFCPSFGDNCSESSFEIYFKAAEDFAKSWGFHDNPYDFLHNEFRSNQCYSYLNTEIEKSSFSSFFLRHIFISKPKLSACSILELIFISSSWENPRLEIAVKRSATNIFLMFEV